MLRDALVVGVNTYQNLPGLKAPARDAEAVAKTLQTYGEFRVHRLPEVIHSGQPQVGQKNPVTLQMLESALIQLFKPKGCSVAQTALFYFSGHGLQRDAGIREGFLAPSDADPDRGFHGLSLFWLRRLLQESPVRQRIIILDCCHSGELLNFLEADPGAAPGTDRLFMAASREYETAYESIDSPYSVFTQALLTGLDPRRSATGVINHHALTDWVNFQLKGEIQQPLFESSGSEIILTRQITRINSSEEGTVSHCPQTNLTLAKSTLPPVCPYRGLECFEEPHTAFFFGRESLTAELLHKVESDRFVAVVGASGIGKSSLVQAGLIPLLRQVHQNQTSANWQIKLLTPGQNPLKSLAAAFVDPEANTIERAEQLGRAEQLLRSGAAGFVQLVRGSLSENFGTTGLLPKTRSQMLLVIDQLEEIFTQGHVQSDAERQQFIACLSEAWQSLADCLKVVVVLRSDFIDACRQHEAIASQISQHSVVVPPLKYEQLKAAIVRPAQKVGLRCEPNLVYTLLLDIMGAPGELALLQSTLLELWERRQSGPDGTDCLTLDSYRELGGIRQLLPERATALFHRFDTAEQAIAQRIFLALTQFGEGTEDTRRRVFKSQLVSPAFAPEKAELVERILEKLVSAKLLVTDQAGLNVTESVCQDDRKESDSALGDRPAKNLFFSKDQASTQPQRSLWNHSTYCRVQEKATQAVVDIAHETLIRHWRLLREWCDRDRDVLRQQRTLEEAAQVWFAAGQPTSIEFLLTGQRLQDAEKLIANHAQDFSALTQEYILVSRQEEGRMQRESRRLRIAVPFCLVATLGVVLGQSLSAIQAQTEKDQQLRLAASRERAAIAQTILQEASSPTTALLVGRLAVQDGFSEVAQASLRRAMQSLRLQLELPITQSQIQQLQISPSQRQLAAASGDGKIHLWAIQPHTLYSRTSPPQPGQILDWTIGATESGKDKLQFGGVQFSPDSQSIAAFAEGQPDIKVWSSRYGALLLHLKGSAPVTQIRFSPTGHWIASIHADRSLVIWRSDTGALQTRLLLPQPIDSVQFAPNGDLLLDSENVTHRYRLIRTAHQSLQLQSLQLQATALPTQTISIRTELIQVNSVEANSLQANPLQAEPLQANQIKQTVFSPQSKWIATLSLAGQVSLWHSQTGQLVGRFSAHQAAKMQFSPNDQRLAVQTGDRLLLYDISTKHLSTKHLRQMPLAEARFNSMASTSETELTFSADGRWLVTRTRYTLGSDKLGSDKLGSDKQQVIQVWDGRSGEPVGMPLPDHSATEVHFSPDNAYLITGDTQGRLKFWSVQTGGELPTLEQASAPTQWTAFLQHGESNDKTQLVTIAANGQLQRWAVPAVPAVTIAPPRSDFSMPIHTAALNPQNFWQQFTQFAIRHNFFAKADSRLHLPAGSLPVPAEISQAGQQSSVPAGISDGTETRSPVAGAALPRSATVSSSLSSSRSKQPLSSVALSRDGEWFAAADSNGTISLQQRQSNQEFQARYQIQNWQLGSRSPQKSALSQVVSGQASSAAHPVNHRNSVRIRQLSFSPNGQYLLGVGDDLTVRLWQVGSGKLVQVWHGHQATLRQARFSPDGSQIVTVSQDKTARIWQIPSAQSEIQSSDIQISDQPITVFQHSTAVNSSSFSPDHRQIVTGSEDGKVRIYDRETGHLRFVLLGHQGAITDVQYSPSGKSIVTASTDGTAIVWSAETGEQQAMFDPTSEESQLQPLLQATFSPDGQYVATLTQNGQVQLWAATWAHLLTLAQERTTRQLTPEECSRYLKLSVDQCPKLSLPELLPESLQASLQPELPQQK